MHSTIILNGGEMKILLLSMLLIPYIVFGELVCPLIDGCPIKNGASIGCIEKQQDQKIILANNVNRIEEPERFDPKPILKKKINKPANNWVGTLRKGVVGCWKGVGYWDDGGNCYPKLFINLLH